MFNNERNGYSKKEVDAYVAKQKAEFSAINSDLKAQNVELKAEIEEIKAELRKRKQSEDQIKDAMLLAAEKTKEINAKLNEVESSAHEYKVQCERVKKLYYKWANTIDAVHKKYGLINSEELNTRKFYIDIEKLFDNNLNQTTTSLVARPANQIVVEESETALEEQKIHHKELLSRMSGLLHSVSASVRDASRHKLETNKPSQIESQVVSKPTASATKQAAEKEFANEYTKETKRIKAQPATAQSAAAPAAQPEEQGKDMIKPIGNMEGDYKGYSSLLDKYLSIGDDDMGAYGKVITNKQEKQKAEEKKAEKAKQQMSKELNLPQVEMGVGTNGFDLKEAVTPKESLEDIMKIFDIE